MQLRPRRFRPPCGNHPGDALRHQTGNHDDVNQIERQNEPQQIGGVGTDTTERGPGRKGQDRPDQNDCKGHATAPRPAACHRVETRNPLE